MHVVLPGEPDAAVQLDPLGGGPAQGLQRLGQGEPARLLAVGGGAGPGRVVRRRAGRLHLDVGVGQPVLDRLEGADRPPELLALPHVLHGPLQHPAGRPHGLGGETDGDGVAEPGERGEDVVALTPQQLTLNFS